MRRFPIPAHLPRGRRALAPLLLPLLLVAGCGGESLPPLTDDRFDAALFRSPPASLGPHVRWWWPGGAVDDDTIRADVGTIASAGFGGIELQTLTFGLGTDDLAADARIRTVGTPDYQAHVRVFLAAARARGLATSLTLGSGWSSGGTFSSDVRPVEILHTRVDVSGPSSLSLPVPTPAEPSWVGWSNGLFPVIGSFTGPFDLVSVLAMPIVDGSAAPPVLGTPIDLTASVQGGTLAWDVPTGAYAIVFFHRHRVDHLVAAAALPDPKAHVIDHLDPFASSTWRTELVTPWLDAVLPAVPDEVFVDSFELVADLPWSDALPGRFLTERGYTLTPMLPWIVREGGEAKYQDLVAGESGPAFSTGDEVGTRVREDYEDLRGELFDESFVEPLAALAHARGTRLRLQAHGGYENVLDGYALADVPESEGLFAGGSMDFLELAASAAHVTGARIVSSESFVIVSPGGTAMSEDEMWMLAGRAYVAGINRLMFHGHAYPYARQNGAPWFPFHPDPQSGVVSAGPFDITSDLRLGEPDWAFVPEMTRALTRLTYAMSRGVDRTEVAWLLADREIPDKSVLRLGTLLPEQEESPTSLALRSAGYTYDRISPTMLAGSSAASGALRVGNASYEALLVTDLSSADPALLDAIGRALDAGVPVIVRGALPTRARGYGDPVSRDQAVTTKLAALQARLVVVADDASIAGSLASASVLPSVVASGGTCTRVSRAHREVSNGHVVLLFHEYPEACTATLDLRVGGSRASLLDPRTGAQTALPATDHVTVDLPAQRPLVLFVER